MKTKTDLIENLPAKLVACVFVLVCFAIGAVGLVLPIIPGLLFLAIGVLIVSKHFPSTQFWLRKSRTLDRHLDHADRFFALTFRRKVLLGGLFCVKILLDSVAFVGSSVTKLLNLAPGKPRYER